MKRAVILALSVAALALAAWLLPVQEWVKHVSPVWAVPLGVLLLCALVPRTPISLGYGVLFGAVYGSVYAILTAMIATVVTYFAGRWAGPDYLAKRFGPRVHKADSWLAERGLLAVIVVRMMPVLPFGLMGYLYGTSSVQKRHYFAGTMIGLTPGAISYAVIGSAVIAPESITWLTFVPIVFGFTTTAIAVFIWRRQHVRSRRQNQTV